MRIHYGMPPHGGLAPELQFSCEADSARILYGGAGDAGLV